MVTAMCSWLVALLIAIRTFKRSIASSAGRNSSENLECSACYRTCQFLDILLGPKLRPARQVDSRALAACLLLESGSQLKANTRFVLYMIPSLPCEFSSESWAPCEGGRLDTLQPT